MFNFLSHLSAKSNSSSGTSKKALQFHIDEIAEGQIVGWAWSPRKPKRKLGIELLSGGKVIAHAEANRFRADLKQAGKGDGACSFRLMIPDHAAKNQPAKLSLRVEGMRRPFHRLTAATIGQKVEFHIDESSTQRVAGWARFPNQPDNRVNIEFFEGSTVLGKVVADQFRLDLQRMGKGDGHCAFGFAIPSQLLDGGHHVVGMRVAGSFDAFHMLDGRTYGKLNSDIDAFSLTNISGAIWIAQHPGQSVAYRVSLNGEVLHEAITDAAHRAEWSASADEIWKYIKGASVDGKASVLLALHANGYLCRSQTFTVRLNKNGDFGFILETLSNKKLRGRFIVPNAHPGGIPWLGIDDAVRVSVAPDKDGLVEVALAPFKLADGQRKLSLRIGEPADASVALQLDYSRFEAELDIQDDMIVGALADHWAEARETGIEILIDNQPVAVEVARKAADDKAGRHVFQVPISQRWRNGQPHTAQFRVIGGNALFPSRPVMFQAGTPSANALCRIDMPLENRLTGSVILPWAPEAVADVRLFRGDSELLSTRADSFDPILAAHGLLPTQKGFELDLSTLDHGTYTLNITVDGHYSSSHQISKLPKRPFRLQAASYGRTGICFVLPDPGGDMQDREEARTILFAAASIASTALQPITIMLEKGESELHATNLNLESIVTDLIGRAGARSLEQVNFVSMLASPLPSTAFGIQAPAYNLDIWLRANTFSRLVTTSRSGVAAYHAMSRRQGLAQYHTEIVTLVDTFAIVDALNGECLLERPELLFSEALEREAIQGSDVLIAPNAFVAKRGNEVVRRISERIEILPIRLPQAAYSATSKADIDVKWIIFAGPLQAASGIIAFCDALDRIMRRPEIDCKHIGVIFAGSDDWLRGRRASAYIRSRAQKWPFQLRVFADLTWDSLGGVLAGFSESGISITLPYLEGTSWEALCRTAGLRNADLAAVRRPDNATDLADAIEMALLKKTDDTRSYSRDGSGLADRLTKPVEMTEIQQKVERLYPLVSVCISHFNRPTLLRQTLASIAASDYPNFEIVVLDDGSSVPGVKEELAQVADEIAEINGRVVTQRNSYLGAARNAAAKEAKGEMIIFMDDDNLACSDMITAFVSIQQLTGASIVTSRFGQFDGTDKIHPTHDVPRSIGAPLLPDFAAGVLSNCFGDANMLITREAFEKIGGFTEDFGRGHEDWELLARASALGIHQELANRPYFWYRVAATSMLRNRETDVVDFQRNIRGYGLELTPELYRIAQLAQGMVHRWDRAPRSLHRPARAALNIAGRMAFGRVAVIMRTKDRPLLLMRAIDSVINQTFSDWVLIVVNDGGNPAPVRQLLDERRAALEGRFMLINNPTSTGMENASNAGIANSASEFVVIHDDDDSWDPCFLERCVTHLDVVSPEIGGVVTHATVIIEEILDGGSVIERDRFPYKNIEAVDLPKLIVENQFPPISFLFRRSVINVVGHFDGKLPVLGDWDFHLRVAKRFQIDVVQEPLALYHHRVKNTDGDYGNTVVAGEGRHRVQRSYFINEHMRNAIDGAAREGGFSDGEMLLLGEFQRDLTGKIQDLKDHIGWIEKLLNDRGDHMRYIEDLISSKLK